MENKYLEQKRKVQKMIKDEMLKQEKTLTEELKASKDMGKNVLNDKKN